MIYGDLRMNIIYNSAARLCVEFDGIVVHVEKQEKMAEARVPGSGGPRSGRVAGRVKAGHWEVEPSSDLVRNLIERAVEAS